MMPQKILGVWKPDSVSGKSKKGYGWKKEIPDCNNRSSQKEYLEIQSCEEGQDAEAQTQEISDLVNPH